MSNTRKTGPTDRTITQRLEERDATHNTVYQCSVGTAILKLRDRYFGQHPTEDDLKKQYQICCDNLDKLTVNEFFKPGEADLPQNAALKSEITAELPGLIALIKLRMTEPPMQFDMVNMYVPTPDNPDRFHEQNMAFPLNVVFPLLMIAFSDDKQFANSYKTSIKNISSEECLSLAIKEKPLRYLSIFRCLQRVREGICHTGVRNELMTQLNGIYEGIHILEDADATANAFMTDQSYRLFYKTYFSCSELAEKKALLHLLYNWMLGEENTHLFKAIDANQSIKMELNQILIENGINPAAYEKLIDETYHSLVFKPDPSNYQVLANLALLLNAHEDSPSPSDSMLLEASQWIRDEFILGNKTHEEHINDVYLAYVTYLKLTSYSDILITAGQKTEDGIRSDLTFLNKIIDGNQIDLSASERHQIKALSDELTRFEENTFKPEIENIFDLWSQKSELTSKSIYVLLSNSRFTSAAACPDDLLTRLKMKNLESDGTNTYLNLTPYFVNRLFLHAIITNPHEWTDTFVSTLKEVTSVIKMARSNTIVLSQNDSEWIKSSSYNSILKQIDYLQAVNEHRDPPPKKPKEMLILPKNIRTVDEWIDISPLLTVNKRHEIFLSLRNALLPNFTNCLEKYPLFFEKVYSTIPDGLKESFILALIKSTSDISVLCSIAQFIYSRSDSLSYQTKNKLLNEIENFLPEKIKSFNDLKLALKTFHNKLSKSILSGIIIQSVSYLSNVDQYEEIFEFVSAEVRVELILSSKEKLPDMIKTPKQFFYFYGLLSQDHQTIIYLVMEKKLNAMATVHCLLTSTIKSLSEKDRSLFISSIKTSLPDRLTTFGRFVDFISIIPKNERDLVYEVMKPKFSDLIKTDRELAMSLIYLSKEKQVTFLQSTLKYLSISLQDPTSIATILNTLPMDSRHEFYNKHSTEIIFSIESFSHYIKIFSYLTPEDQNDLFVKMLKRFNELPPLQYHLIDHLFKGLSTENSVVLYKCIFPSHLIPMLTSYEDYLMARNNLPAHLLTLYDKDTEYKLPDIINNSDDLMNLLKLLPSEKHGSALHILQDKLPLILSIPDYLDSTSAITWNTADQKKNHDALIQNNHRILLIMDQLPRLIASFDELNIILSRISDEQKILVLDKILNTIPRLEKEHDRDISYLLKLTPCTKFKDVCLALKNNTAKHIRTEAVHTLLKPLSNDQLTIFCSVFKDDMSKILKNAGNLKKILYDLDGNRSKIILDSMKGHLSDLIKSPKDFNDFLDDEPYDDNIDGSLETEIKERFYDAIKENLPRLNNQYDAFLLLNCLQPSQKSDCYDRIKNMLPPLIQTASEFTEMMRLLPNEKIDSFLELMQHHSYNFIRHASDIDRLLRDRPPALQEKLYLMLKNRMIEVVNNANEFKVAMKALTTEQRHDFFEMTKNKLPAFIKSGQDIYDTLAYLPPENRDMIYDIIQQHLFDIVTTGNDIKPLFSALPSKQWSTISAALKEKLPSIISNFEQWLAVSSCLNYEENIALLNQLLQNSESLSHLFRGDYTIAINSNDCSFISEFMTKYKQANMNNLPKQAQTFFTTGHTISLASHFCRIMLTTSQNPTSQEALTVKTLLQNPIQFTTPQIILPSQ